MTVHRSGPVLRHGHTHRPTNAGRSATLSALTAALTAVAALTVAAAPLLVTARAHAATAQAAKPATKPAAALYRAVLLVPSADARLRRSRLEQGVLGQPTGPAEDAARIAIDEGAMELDAVGASLSLQTVAVADAAEAKAAAAKAAQSGAAAVLADLPADWLPAVADAAKAPVLNIGAGDDALRAGACRANLFHVAPSERMRTDALAQTLTARKWREVLMLVGPSAEDQARAATAAASMKRYGLKLVATKPFKLSADPRERDLSNPLLLTGPSAGEYDVVWVVDTDGEFAQMLPYRTARPRPVVGDAGLVALSWSSRFDRYGAPQVTRRLIKAKGRPMEAHDWQAWMAAKALVAAAVAAPKGPVPAFQKALANVELDGSKGILMGFRPWSGQLRQPLLLSDGQAVVSMAPVEGILHRSNRLDTLGADAPEKPCKARQ